MKRLLPFLTAVLALVLEASADDRLKDVQTELKTQGFYYGELNGEGTSETTAAIRRYQIRSGLEVTGTLTEETLKSLGVGVPPAGREPQEAPAPAPAPPAPRADLRRDKTLEDSDRNFLRRQEALKQPQARDGAEPVTPLEDDPSGVPTPRSLEAPSADLPVLFAGTPFANAPREVQESTLRRAQSFLASRGLYRDAIDGAAGPATEEALLGYQRSVRLPLTGRLDLETLSRMNLLPRNAPIAPRGFVPPPTREPTIQRVFRGIWIR